MSEGARWYLEQALGFERSKQDALKQTTKFAIRVAVGGGLIGLFGLLGGGALVQLKRPNPPALIRTNDTSGTTDVIGVIRNGEMPFTEVQDRADLRRYVEMRESYDWETIQDMYDTVKLMTADKEQENYVALFQKDTAPQKILKNQVRVVAKVGAITFVGSTAQVFFSKTIKPMSTVQDSQNGMRPQKTEYWVATISYRHDNLPESGMELERDPTGFRVTSYNVDRDWTRSDAMPVVPALGAKGAS
ncbi:type IV secretion system protein [Burkholderia cepacia]|uniref:Type IV secretion system protein n=1 Tax=Burkholderia contaminans TaxID=488447 RepID=A0ABD7YHH1_9BURK|nr:MULTISPECIES: type IV secretion system protein [Burkholderia]EKS9798979.1 type IV secretion system protein [Burkholderia cepacia]EKS9805933.1 type IV secretion system protein [Burkholderia cepacia]EKS9813481.1 type IV secretion system protein [Burkholderia cepacia]EKS9820320.1 type IV secretion system protein [Burkholderia cepacia]EKS9828185.1 type IV secretion system protein [Burkholderia cepacia]